MPKKVCKNCNSPVSGDQYFCPRCGQPLFDDQTKEERFKIPERVVAGESKIARSMQSDNSNMTGRSTGSEGSPQQYDGAILSSEPPKPGALTGHSGGQSRAYSREEIRRMVEEDKRKRAKVLKIGIPACIAVIAIVALVLIFFVFGTGMTSQKYKNKVLALHTPVLDSLINADAVWDAGDATSDPGLTWLPGFGTALGEAGPNAQAAIDGMDALRTPDQISQLHDDLLSFYNAVKDYSSTGEAFCSFEVAFFAIYNDYKQRQGAAAPTDIANTAQTNALIDQEIVMTNSYIARLQALAVPPGCQSSVDMMLSLMNKENALYQTLKSTSSTNSMMADINAYSAAYQEFEKKVSDPLNNYRSTLNNLIQQGKDLEARLQAPGNNVQKPTPEQTPESG